MVEIVDVVTAVDEIIGIRICCKPAGHISRGKMAAGDDRLNLGRVDNILPRQVVGRASNLLRRVSAAIHATQVERVGLGVVGPPGIGVSDEVTALARRPYELDPRAVDAAITSGVKARRKTGARLEPGVVKERVALGSIGAPHAGVRVTTGDAVKSRALERGVCTHDDLLEGGATLEHIRISGEDGDVIALVVRSRGAKGRLAHIPTGDVHFLELGVTLEEALEAQGVLGVHTGAVKGDEARVAGKPARKVDGVDLGASGIVDDGDDVEHRAAGDGRQPGQPGLLARCDGDTVANGAVVVEVCNAHDERAGLVGHAIVDGLLGKVAPPEIGVLVCAVMEFPGVGDGTGRLAAALHVLGKQVGIGAAEVLIGGAQPLTGEVHVRRDALEAGAFENGGGTQDELVEGDVATLVVGNRRERIDIEEVLDVETRLGEVPLGEIERLELVVALEHPGDVGGTRDVKLFGLDISQSNVILEPLRGVHDPDDGVVTIDEHLLDHGGDVFALGHVWRCEATPRKLVVKLLDLVGLVGLLKAERQGVLGHVVAPPDVVVAVEAALDNGIEVIVIVGVHVAAGRIMRSEDGGAIVPGPVLVEPRTLFLTVVYQVGKSGTLENGGGARLDVVERAAACEHVGHVLANHLPCGQVEVLQGRAVAEHLGKGGDGARVPLPYRHLVNDARSTLEHGRKVGDLGDVPIGQRREVGDGSATLEHGGHGRCLGNIPRGKTIQALLVEGGIAREHAREIRDLVGMPSVGTHEVCQQCVALEHVLERRGVVDVHVGGIEVGELDVVGKPRLGEGDVEAARAGCRHRVDSGQLGLDRGTRRKPGKVGRDEVHRVGAVGTQGERLEATIIVLVGELPPAHVVRLEAAAKNIAIPDVRERIVKDLVRRRARPERIAHAQALGAIEPGSIGKLPHALGACATCKRIVKAASDERNIASHGKRGNGAAAGEHVLERVGRLGRNHMPSGDVESGEARAVLEHGGEVGYLDDTPLLHAADIRELGAILEHLAQVGSRSDVHAAGLDIMQRGVALEPGAGVLHDQRTVDVKGPGLERGYGGLCTGGGDRGVGIVDQQPGKLRGKCLDVGVPQGLVRLVDADGQGLEAAVAVLVGEPPPLGAVGRETTTTDGGVPTVGDLVGERAAARIASRQTIRAIVPGAIGNLPDAVPAGTTGKGVVQSAAHEHRIARSDDGVDGRASGNHVLHAKIFAIGNGCELHVPAGDIERGKSRATLEHRGEVGDVARVPAREGAVVLEGDAVLEHAGHELRGRRVPRADASQVGEALAILEHVGEVLDLCGVPSSSALYRGEPNITLEEALKALGIGGVETRAVKRGDEEIRRVGAEDKVVDGKSCIGTIPDAIELHVEIIVTRRRNRKLDDNFSSTTYGKSDIGVRGHESSSVHTAISHSGDGLDDFKMHRIAARQAIVEDKRIGSCLHGDWRVHNGNATSTGNANGIAADRSVKGAVRPVTKSRQIDIFAINFGGREPVGSILGQLQLAM